MIIQIYFKTQLKFPEPQRMLNYGTPQMALEMKRLFDTTDFFGKKY